MLFDDEERKVSWTLKDIFFRDSHNLTKIHIEFLLEYLFFFYVVLCNPLMKIAVLCDDGSCLFICGLQEKTHFLVDHILRLLRHGFTVSLSKEKVITRCIWSIVLSAEFRIKSETHHHRSSDFGRFFYIVRGSCSDSVWTEENFLRDSTTIETREFIEVFCL